MDADRRLSDFLQQEVGDDVGQIITDSDLGMDCPEGGEFVVMSEAEYSSKPFGAIYRCPTHGTTLSTCDYVNNTVNNRGYLHIGMNENGRFDPLG